MNKTNKRNLSNLEKIKIHSDHIIEKREANFIKKIPTDCKNEEFIETDNYLGHFNYIEKNSKRLGQIKFTLTELLNEIS